PVRNFVLKLTASSPGQPVELRPALVLGLAPFRGDEALMLQPVQRRVQGALLDLEVVARDLLDAQQDAVAVLGTERNRFEDEQVERALEELGGRHPRHPRKANVSLLS